MAAFKILNPRANVAAVSQASRLIGRHRGLLWAMTMRDISDRYTGQMLGGAWAILSPLLTMAVYVFVFTFIFRGRLGEDATGTAFTAFALSGLAPWMAMQEGVSRSVSAVTGNANLIKQIVFPSEVLPLKIALATLPTLLIGLAVAIVTALIAGLATPFGLLVKLPVCIASYIVFVAGLSFLLSAIGVYFRDLKDVIAFLLAVGLFLHPILFPPGAAPPWLNDAFVYSPISHFIWSFHEAIVGPVDPHPSSWIIMPLWSIAVFVLGWRTFRWLKPTFGNAL